MRIFKIKKRSGGVRKIYAPNEKEKEKYRDLLETINQANCKDAHAFVVNRNIVTNAKLHTGQYTTISFDLSDFFDSVKPEMVIGKIPVPVLASCFLDEKGVAGTTPDCRTRQGLPTSPAIANIAGIAIDTAIKRKLLKLGHTAIYSRYADDISISFDHGLSREEIAKIKEAVNDCVSRCGFRLNQNKTRIQTGKGGRREICGVTVDGEVHTSRRFRRKARACLHNLNKIVLNTAPSLLNENNKEYIKTLQKAKGYTAFSMLKTPKIKPDFEKSIVSNMKDGQKIAEHFQLLPPLPVKKSIQSEKITFNGITAFITNDPCYFYGMSDYTTGWTSCMSIKGGGYNRGSALWQRFEGVSLAFIPSSDKKALAGVKRTTMRERALVFELRSGRRVYGDVYSSQGHICNNEKSLARALESKGYSPIWNYKGELVKGQLECSKTFDHPYMDNVSLETVTLKESRKKAYRLRVR